MHPLQLQSHFIFLPLGLLFDPIDLALRLLIILLHLVNPIQFLLVFSKLLLSLLLHHLVVLVQLLLLELSFVLSLIQILLLTLLLIGLNFVTRVVLVIQFSVRFIFQLILDLPCLLLSIFNLPLSDLSFVFSLSLLFSLKLFVLLNLLIFFIYHVLGLLLSQIKDFLVLLLILFGRKLLVGRLLHLYLLQLLGFVESILLSRHMLLF